MRGLAPLPDGTPVLAVMGDSHSALFAHGAVTPGQIKATFGTGSSVMGLIARPRALGAGACLTIGWQIGGQAPAFAAEGNIRATGAALRWMATILGMSVEAMTELGARSESRGAVLVPGFTGLGAPWWDRDAVGLISNLALDTGPAQLARAAMEAVVHQVADVVEVIGQYRGPGDGAFHRWRPEREPRLDADAGRSARLRHPPLAGGGTLRPRRRPYGRICRRSLGLGGAQRAAPSPR